MSTSTRLKRTRNFGICAHIDAGKTTVSERILYYTGMVHKIGEVHDGQATTDFDPDEQARGITINSAAVTVEWPRNDTTYSMNVIDTPGHVDFTMEVERSMRVLDGAIVVFDGKEGVEAQSETVWRQAERYRVPRICFINKMDKLGADFDYSFSTFIDRLAAPVVAVQYPIGKAETFNGVIDLIEMKANFYSKEDRGLTVTEEEIPAEYLEKAEELRTELVERAAEQDDDLMEKYLEGIELTNDEIRGAIRKGVLGHTLHPVFCGSALKNTGIQKLVDGVVDFLPDPTEVPDTQGTDPDDANVRLSRKSDESEPFSGLVFKVVNDTHGDLYYMRIYSGKLEKGTRVLNSNNGKREIISRLFRMQAEDREALDVAYAGEIVAIVGLKNSLTGETLCADNDPIVLDRMHFPEPVISMAIEPKSAGDKEKLGNCLANIRRADPSFHFHFEEETGQTIIGGMGELHLDIWTGRIQRDFKCEVNIGAPRVAYRETIMGEAQERGIHKKQSGGRGQFGDCTIIVRPCTEEEAKEQELEWKESVASKDSIVGGVIPREYIPSVFYGARETAKSGVLAGFPMINVMVELIDGKYHDVDSSQIAFEVAGALAFKSATRAAGLQLLEPYMRVQVTTPEEFFGNVTGDLNRRRALVVGEEQRSNIRVITAEAPLSEMFGYSNTLRGMSQGRANYSMEPMDYRPVPTNIADEIVKKVHGENETKK